MTYHSSLQNSFEAIQKSTPMLLNERLGQIDNRGIDNGKHFGFFIRCKWRRASCVFHWSWYCGTLAGKRLPEFRWYSEFFWRDCSCLSRISKTVFVTDVCVQYADLERAILKSKSHQSSSKDKPFCLRHKINCFKSRALGFLKIYEH